MQKRGSMDLVEVDLYVKKELKSFRLLEMFS